MRDLERIRWPTAVLTGVWATGFSWGEPPATLLAVPFTVASVLLASRFVVASAALVTVAAAITAVGGTSYYNPDLVPAIAITLVGLGHDRGRLGLGLATAVGCAGLAAARSGFAVGDLVAPLILYPGFVLLGRLVRVRAAKAEAAVAAAATLAETDPATESLRLAREERDRLANAALVSLRSAIVSMRAAASDALTSLDPGSVLEVHGRGAVAITELRALLGLLREPAPPEEPGAPRARRAPWRLDLLFAAGLVAFTLALWAAKPDTIDGAPWLTAAAVLAVALRHTNVLLACAVVATGGILQSFDVPAGTDALAPGGVAHALLAWTLAGTRRHIAWPGFALLALPVLMVGTRYDLQAVGYGLVNLLVPALVGLAWGEHDRILRGAESDAARHRGELDAAASRAIREEKLRLARELHDVSSHSVGAMVMQASVARALSTKAPDEARAALHTVIAAGARALEDVSALVAALDSSDPTPTDPDALPHLLHHLVAERRAAGQDIRLDLQALPTTATAAATTYRIVWEGLNNAARHAPGASVSVRIERDGTDLVVTVRDNGAPTPDAVQLGFGLTGLQERLHACRGTLAAGPDAAGGFTLVARLAADCELTRNGAP